MKNITSEMKNILARINSRLGTTEEPENIAMETIQNETQRKRLEKKSRVLMIYGTIPCSLICM